MRRVTILGLGILSLLIIGTVVPLAQGTSTEWSSEIVSKTYHWYAEKSELRDIEGNESYRNGMLGGWNIPGGDNAVHLRSTPPDDFDIFAGDRLDFLWTVEGDMGIWVTDNSDIHLTILPVRMNGTDFFEQLFSEQVTLENLTQSEFVNSTIEASRATATLKYNDILDVVYVWDTSTGLLARKEVTAPSGKQLVVVPGIGIGFYSPSASVLLFVLVTTLFLLCIGLSFRHLSRR